MSTFLNIVVKDSPLESPFLPKEKRWVAAALAAVASIGSAIIGSASNNSTNNTNEDLNKENIKMQKETNALNAELTRETNAQNYKMFQEQNAFNLDMWNKQNEYNKPAQEVQRLLAAGINPASKFGSAAQASSIQSASPAAAVAPNMQAPKNEFMMRPSDFSGISESGIAAVNAYNASRLAASETKNKDALTASTTLDTSIRSKTMADSIRALKAMADKGGYEALIAKKQLAFIEATQNYDIQMKYGDTLQQQKSIDMLEKQIQYQELQNDVLNITRGYADQLNRAQIAQIWKSISEADARIGLIYANKMLTETQQYHEMQKVIGTQLDNDLKGINNQVTDAIKGCLIKDAKNRTKMLQYDSSMQGARDMFGFMKGMIPNVGFLVPGLK